MIAVLRQRNFGVVWFGGLISLAGDYTLIVGVPLFVYRLTGSTLATGTIVMAGLLPRLLLGSVAGVFVDRWDRKRTMVTVNLLLAVCLLPLLVVHSASRLWIVYAVQFIESSLVQFFSPAEAALLPRLVQEGELVAANALIAINQNLARLVGAPLGGVVYALVKLNGIVLIDAASFLVSALLIARVTAPALSERSRSSDAASSVMRFWVRVWREWYAGVRLLLRQHTTAAIFAFVAITAVGEGVFSTLFVPFVVTVIGGDARAYGYILAAQAIGGLLGSIVIGHLGGRVATRRVFGIAAVVFGCLALLLFYYPLFIAGSVVAIALMILVGLPAAAMGIGQQTLLQTSVADAYRGRLFGALNTTGALSRLLGATLAGVLGDRVGIVPILTIQGAGYMLGGAMLLSVLTGRRVGTNGELPQMEMVGTEPPLPQSQPDSTLPK